MEKDTKEIHREIKTTARKLAREAKSALQTSGASRKNMFILAVLASTVLFWSGVFYFIDPQDLVRRIGVENGYLLMFGVSLFGGVSSLTFGSYFGTLIALSAGGLSPWMLGLVSGLGVTFGDTLFYYLGRQGRRTINRGSSYGKLIGRITRWLDKRPAWLTPLFIYLYTSFTPFPNDLLTIAMGLAQRSYFLVIVPLVLGNVTITILVATFGSQISWLW